MFIGVEATTDYWVTFNDLSHLKEWLHLGFGLTNAFSLLSRGKGDEEVIDHVNNDDMKLLLKNLATNKIKVESALGGNAALEVLTGKTQGINVSYFGTLPNLNISKIEHDTLRNSFIGEIVPETPFSIIIQMVQNTTERYIFNNGIGRRANDILPSLLKANDVIKGDDILLGLVGVHVLFGTKRFDLISTYQNILEEFRKNVGMTYTDTGGFSVYSPSEIKVLFEQIYAQVDAIAINELELNTIYHTFERHSADVHPVEKLAYIINQFEAPKTAWLHTVDSHISLSKEFSTQILKESMKKAAAAGCFRVETGNPPTQVDILEIIRNRQLNPVGIKTVNEIKELYGTTFQGLKIAALPSFLANKFTTSVGAGDTACATYFGNFISNNGGIN